MWFQQKFYQGSASGLRMSAWRAGYTDVCWMGSPFLALSMSMNRLGETPVALLNTMDIEWYRCRPTSTFWSTPDICWRNPPDIWWQTWFKVVFYILGGFTFPKQRLSVISEDKMLEASDGDSVAKTSTPTMMPWSRWTPTVGDGHIFWGFPLWMTGHGNRLISWSANQGRQSQSNDHQPPFCSAWTFFISWWTWKRYIYI